MSIRDDPSYLFTLRVQVFAGGPAIIIHAFDQVPYRYSETGHSYIDVVVRQGRRTIFARGDTWCGVPGGTTTDGKDARELVMTTVAMKPGDTDADYFASYTPEQLEWAERYGEHISCEASARYCCRDCGSVGKRTHCSARRK